ncbi:toxin-antitoxin system, toxin component [Streptomyces sp. NPDC051362]|uniref:toxin-antitoxin system, toxin component n=1 Tax=Streptomyces sp. NPDC051362 TaxID=3365651 RepID=UPI0037B4A6A1
MKGSAARAVAKDQRKLMAELVSAVSSTMDVPAEPAEVFQGLCTAMGKRRGRPVVLTIRPFPAEVADNTTGLWLDLPEQDVIVVEESLTPDHQLVVLGHELWHMHAGHCGHDLGGSTTAAARAAFQDQVDWPELARRVAARSHSDQADEVDAEAFGLLVSTRIAGWLATPGAPRQHDDVARRLRESLGYLGPQG